MKDLVIIGGAGPEAGILLFQQIIKLCQTRYYCKNDRDFPYITLLNFPFSEMLERERAASIHREIESLVQEECNINKCHYWTIACNTIHLYLDDVCDSRFLHLIETVRNNIREKPLVLCSNTSAIHKLHASFFACEYPNHDDQMILHTIINEILCGKITKEQSLFLKSLVFSHPSNTAVLGCTEFSLLHSKFPISDRILDPSQIMAEKFCTTHFGRKNGAAN